MTHNNTGSPLFTKDGEANFFADGARAYVQPGFAFDTMLTGLLTINGLDIWTRYNAFLAEKGNSHDNYNALFRLPKAKEIPVVDFREMNGVSLPVNLKITLSSIERTLRFAIIGESHNDRLMRYRKFKEMLCSGKLDITIKGLKTYRMLYKDMPSEPEWYNAYDDNYYITIFQVKFLDYAPV